jgi:hypothetical protein
VTERLDMRKRKDAQSESSQPERLQAGEIARVMEGWPDDVSDLAWELRDVVLKIGPDLAETVAFNSLCYYKPRQPYGVIGGNVCGIGHRGDCLHLGFIHGASLPDPQGLLQGTGKAKRHVELRTSRDVRRRAVGDLIRAAIAFRPEA